MAKVSVIVPAAGAGVRFGGDGNKIFRKIKSQPIFLRTLELFTGRDDVIQIQLVIAEADAETIKSKYGGNLGFMGVQVVTGGPTRCDSVRNALARVADEAELICVHDGVRPCVSPLWIDAVFAKAQETGAGILAVPVHGTLKKVSEGGTVEKTVSRAQLWSAQTPQVFRKDLLLRAYEQDAQDATDDAQLVERLGQEISVVPGDPRNIKITTPRDLALAAAVIETLPQAKPKGPAHPFAEAQW